MQNALLRRFPVSSSLIIASAFALALNQSVRGADSTWNATTGTNLWTAPASWVSGTPAGANPSTTDLSTATFNGSAAAQTVTVDSLRNVFSLQFNTGAGTALYTFSGGPLLLTSGGNITMNPGASSVTMANRLLLRGNATINNSAASVYLGSGAIAGDTGSGPLTFTLTGTNGGGVTAPSTTAQNQSSITGVISDGGGVVSLLKSGTGFWNVNAVNTFSGNVTIDGGVLNVLTIADEGSNSSIGKGNSATGSDLVFNGGALEFTGYSGGSQAGSLQAAQTTNRLFTIGDATGGAVNTATIDSSSTVGNAISRMLYNGTVGTVSFTNTGTIKFGTAGTHTLTLTGFNVGNNNFAPQILDGGGATSLVKSGVGTWVLTNANPNTYTGLTRILGGVLRDATSTGTGVSSTSNVELNNGVYESATDIARALGTGAGQLQVTGGTAGFSANGPNPVNVTLGVAGSTIQYGSGSSFNPGSLYLNAQSATNNLTFNNGLDFSGKTQEIITSARTATITGGIVNGGLVKSGDGTLALNGVNTYGGGTTVAGGILSIGSGSSIGTGGATVYGNGLLRLNNTSNVAVGQKVVVNAGGGLGVGSNSFDQTAINAILDPSSTGVLAIDTTNYTNSLNMATIGNAGMYLGSSSNGVYSGSSLTFNSGTAGAYPVTFGNTYLLGGGGGTLTFATNVIKDTTPVLLLSNPNNLLATTGGVNAPSVIYTATSNTRSSVKIGQNAGLGQGTVKYATNQSYTGTTTVNNGSTLGLDYTGAIAAPTGDNILAAGNEVDLAGGGLSVTGNSTTGYIQTLSRLGLNNGGNTLTTTKGSAALNVNLGVLGNGTAGGTINASPGASLQVVQGAATAASVVTTTATGADTVGNIGTYGGQVVYTDASGVTTWAQGQNDGAGNYTLGAYAGDAANILPTTGGSSSVDYLMNANKTLTGPTTVNLLRISAGALSGTATNSLTVGGGGILFTNAAGVSFGGGTLGGYISSGTAANSGGYNFLDLQNYGTGGVTLAPATNMNLFKDTNANTHTVVVFSGPGAYSLGAGVTANTGGVVLNGSTLGVTGGSLGTSGIFTINSGTLISNYPNGSGSHVDTNMVWNGNFTLGATSQSIGGTTNFALNGTIRLNNNIVVIENAYQGTWTLAGAISDGGYGYGLTIDSLSGALSLGAANSFTGPIQLGTGGNLTVGNTSTNRNNLISLGTGTTFVINGGNQTQNILGLTDVGVGGTGTVTRASSTSNAVSTVTSWGSGAYNYSGSVNDLVTTAVGKRVGVAMNGLGTQTYSGVSGFTGGASANAGTLFLDGSKGGSWVTNTLALGGGTFKYKGTTTGSTQTLGNVTSTAGGSTIAVDSNGAGTTALNLGTVTASAGGTVNFTAIGAAAPTIATATGNTNGVLGANAGSSGHFVYTDINGNTTWATGTSVGVGVNTIGAYTGDTTPMVPTGGVTTTNYNLTAGQTQTGSTSIGLLRVSNTADGTLDLNGTSLTLNGDGLLFNGTSTYAINDTPGTGFITSGTTVRDVVIQNYGKAALTIGASIRNNGTAGALTISGPGTTILTGANTYSGGTFLNNGTVVFNSLANFTSTSGFTFSGATLKSATGNTTDITSLGKTITVNASGATFDTNGNSFTLGTMGNLTGVGGVTFVDTGATHGIINVSGPSAYTGFTTIGNGARINMLNTGNFNNSAGTIIASGGQLSGATNLQTTTSGQSGTPAGRILLQSGGVLMPGGISGSANAAQVQNKGLAGGGLGDNNSISATMNAAQLTWNAGGTLKFQLDNTVGTPGTALNPSASTTLNLGTGALVKGGGQGQYVLDFQNSGTWDMTVATDGTNVYDLINFGVLNNYGEITGNTNFNIDDFTIINLNGLGTLSFWYNPAANAGQGQGQEELILTVIPEPSTYAMLMGGLAALAFWTRRRGKNRLAVKA